MTVDRKWHEGEEKVDDYQKEEIRICGICKSMCMFHEALLDKFSRRAIKLRD